MMSGYVKPPVAQPRPRGSYEVVEDPLGWRVVHNGCATPPFFKQADAVRLAHRLQREADGLRGAS